jgi:DNA-binding CsgD family transcriptional regulator
LGPVILSLRPLGSGSASGVGLYRRHEDPPFTPRECRIAHIVLSETAWLHHANWPEDLGIPKLYPRQRLVLNLLLQGDGRKSISEHLGISVNTVSGYVKAIYRHFEVRSHAALMRRFQIDEKGNQTCSPWLAKS